MGYMSVRIDNKPMLRCSRCGRLVMEADYEWAMQKHPKPLARLNGTICAFTQDSNGQETGFYCPGLLERTIEE